MKHLLARRPCWGDSAIEWPARPEDGERYIARGLAWFRNNIDVSNATIRERRAFTWALFAAREYHAALAMFASIASEQPENIPAQGQYGIAAAAANRRAEADSVRRWLLDLDDRYIHGVHLRVDQHQEHGIQLNSRRGTSSPAR